MSHTKGPWKVGKWKDSQEVMIDAPNGEPDFKTVKWEGLAVVYGSDDEDFDKGHRKCEDNARLISAAPELLEALQKAVADYGREGGPWNVPRELGTWIYTARKAIAKATGGTV